MWPGESGTVRCGPRPGNGGRGLGDAREALHRVRAEVIVNRCNWVVRGTGLPLGNG